MRFLRLWEGAFLATADLLGRTSQASVIDLRKQWRTLRDFLDTDSFLYSDGPPNEPPPLNEPPAILSADLSLDSPQSIQGPCFMVSAI